MAQVEGAVIGDRYRLRSKIGEGGMATVWEAEHVALGNLLAVKFLHRTAPKGSEVADRFLREARVAAQVKHRNVVDINDFGFTEDDVPYMVMERLRGQPLSDYLLLHGALDFEETARLVSLTLRGLAAVHDAGIVHRDLKPDNIFLVHDEDGLFPKLLDFGLSRPAGKSKLTMEGTLMGTPDYMSPEQARGMIDLDARTDIYSMGVILYEMITANMPFQSEHIGDLIAMISRDPPMPIETFRPDAPPELVSIIETAMSKDREQRYQNARDMRSALVELWAINEAGSGLTSLSELPPAPDGPPTGRVPRVSRTPGGGVARRTGSGVGTNPALRPSVGSGVAANPALPGAVGAPPRDSIRRPTPDTLDAVDARKNLEEAPTMAGLPGMALPSPAPAPSQERPAPPQERSAFATGISIALVAAMGATFIWVWIARGGGEDVAQPTLGDIPMLGALAGEPDAGSPWDAGIDAGPVIVDAGAPAVEEEEPTKRRPTKRRIRRPTKRRARTR